MAQRSEKTIKVCLTNRGEDSETPWAHDLGPAPGQKGSRRVRLVNVPFLHAKPTWGDVIVVSPVQDGLPTWDRNGAEWKDIGKRIAEDGGRWAMILDYTPHPGDPTGDAAFRALAAACEAGDIVCEGAWAPGKQPGRTYLAVRNEYTADDVMTVLRAVTLPCELIQVHPAPSSPAKKRTSDSGPRTSAPKKRTSDSGLRTSARTKPKTATKPKAKVKPKAKAKPKSRR